MPVSYCLTLEAAGSDFLPLQIVDKAANHAQSLVPEGRIGSVQPEGGQQFTVPLSAAGRQHLQVPLRESIGRVLVDRVQGIDQAVAEGIGVDVERRVNEVGDVGPVVPVSLVEAERRA